MKFIIGLLVLIMVVLFFGPLAGLVVAFGGIIIVGAMVIVVSLVIVAITAYDHWKNKPAKIPTDFPPLDRKRIEGTEYYRDQYNRKWRKTKSGVFKMCRG